MSSYFIVECPHCLDSIVIFHHEINCRIFRHAVYKSTYQQVNPHLSKVECDRLVQSQLVYGCGKPFRINDHLEAETCGYI